MDMGDAKHTPGPWKAVEPTAIDYRSMQIQTDESLIAVCCGGGPKRAISAPEERANARLIAAAPDLLEALRKTTGELRDLRAMVYGECPSLLEDHFSAPNIDDAIESGDAALTKAGV